MPAGAARPLLDRHEWDAYFALFARDSNVPWKPASVRLDTYSGAPVDFAAYNVDPADVIVAGASRSSRALATGGRRPVARWRFSPPPGYRFESSDVPMPPAVGEGFYVIEARRGDAVQQIWLNRTHVGLLTKESPDGLLLWGVDLRSGRALAGLNVSFLVGLRLVARRADARGIVVWTGTPRPTFALAEHGAGRAFVSILPQAPLPASVVGLRAESAVVRAGERLRFVGFARRRSRDGYRSAGGEARIALAGRGRTLATAVAPLDGAGAFAGELVVPAGVDTGDYALLASAAGGVGGATVHLDAAGDLALAIEPACPCDPARDVAFFVAARRGDVPATDADLRVRVVRAPHVVAPGAAEDAARWGTTVVDDLRLRTDGTGRAQVVIASPSDGLDSTYGIRVTARGASATSRIVVPNAKFALALEPVAPSADVGEPVAFDVRGFDPADGSPAANLAVDVRLSHGASVQDQTVRLDESGRARALFKSASLGSNLALARADVEGRRALDAAAIVVEPRALGDATAGAQHPVTMRADKVRYRPGERIAVRAELAGASGDALVTLEGAATYAVRLAPVANGGAAASLTLGPAQGAVRVGAALVRDGVIATGAEDLNVDGAGHVRLTELALDKASYAPGEVLHATVRDGGPGAGATLAVRVADGRESGAALFDDAPDVLRTGATLEQTPASATPAWHAYVAPARSKASDIFAAERPRKAATDMPSLGIAAPRTLYWRVARADGETFDVPVPRESGRFVLSILKVSDDGDVGAASASFRVE